LSYTWPGTVTPVFKWIVVKPTAVYRGGLIFWFHDYFWIVHMSAPFRITKRVEFRETDAAGIAHFTAFFGYMEEAEHAMLREMGIKVMTADPGGTISWPRVSAHCDFRAPVRFDDEIDVLVCVTELGEKSVKYGVRFLHNETLIAEGYMVAACCRVASGEKPRSIAIPSEMAQKLATMKSPTLDD
jgi:4-hydroxybenzoyl-CoA thioesterase/acyl-CoA thioester hydrolase